MQDIQILYVPESHRLEFILHSALDIPTTKAISEQADLAIDQYQCQFLLLDLSQTLSIISAAQNFDLVHDFDSFSWSEDRYWAILYKNDAHLYEVAAKLIEQRGTRHIQFFTDRAKAIAWLDAIKLRE
jgi:hypothetical protein